MSMPEPLRPQRSITQFSTRNSVKPDSLMPSLFPRSPTSETRKPLNTIPVDGVSKLPPSSIFKPLTRAPEKCRPRNSRWLQSDNIIPLLPPSNTGGFFSSAAAITIGASFRPETLRMEMPPRYLPGATRIRSPGLACENACRNSSLVRTVTSADWVDTDINAQNSIPYFLTSNPFANSTRPRNLQMRSVPTHPRNANRSNTTPAS